jgi:signal transduction histidine kinase
MQSDDSPILVEWIVMALRWLALLGLALTLGWQGDLTLFISLLLFAAGCANSAWMVLTGLDRRRRAYRFIALGIDLLAAYMLFGLSGGLAGKIGWAGLLPLITASLYYQLRGGLLVAILNLLVQGALALAGAAPLPVLVFLGTLAPLYLGIGLVFGSLGRRISSFLVKAQKQKQVGQMEAERNLQQSRSALFQQILSLTSTLNYQRVLDKTLDVSTAALATTEGSEDTRLTSAVLLYSQEEGGETLLRFGSARRFTPADQRISLPGTSGLIGRAIDEGEPRLAKDPAKDPELGRLVTLRACQSVYCIPLRRGLDNYGVLLFAHPDPNYFTPERREILEILGSQAVVAIQNARLYRDLEQEKERMTEIQEEARKKLARDLHDGPTQSVAALAMRVNFARRLMDRDPKAAGDELFKVEDLARRTTKEIRHMLFTLRPLVLESEGLAAALQSMADKMRETYGQDVLIMVEPEVVAQLEAGKQGVIFYIAEEAVNNARKHANAGHIWVRLKPAGEELALLEIEDNGKGFNVSAMGASYEKGSSLGMVNMRERAELVNGILQVESEEGRGTRIQLLIPLSEEAADRLHRGV